MGRTGGSTATIRPVHLVASFNLDPANPRPSSIAGDGGVAYVLDDGVKRVFRYEHGIRAAVAAELRRHDGSGLSRSAGLAIDRDEMWVIDRGRAAMFQYSVAGMLATGGRVSATAEIALDPDNGRAQGLAIDELFLYMVDEVDKQVYVYSRSGAALGRVADPSPEERR